MAYIAKVVGVLDKSLNLKIVALFVHYFPYVLLNSAASTCIVSSPLESSTIRVVVSIVSHAFNSSTKRDVIKQTPVD